MTLREQLSALAEPDYRRFTTALLPGVEDILGVRLPHLRRLAGEVLRGDWHDWPDRADDSCFEERMLRGMVIAKARCAPDEKQALMAQFIPRIDNWSICDGFCWRLKRAERAPMWRFIQPYFESDAEFGVRFAVVMALKNFVDTEHLAPLLDRLGNIRHEGYYVRMGVAWAVSVCYVKFPAETHAWLAAACPLDDWTFNKSLQKITESFRVEGTAKAAVRKLRRPTEKIRKSGNFAK